MASTSVLIPVEEYLRTSYRPDRDYIDGEVLERNMGEKPHARLQTFFARFFAEFELEWKCEVLTEQRLYISPTRYRIPDVMLSQLADSGERIVRTPPLLCIEILSSNDRIGKVQERIRDYASIGVRSSWVVDPWRETASFAGPDGALQPVTDVLTLPGTQVEVPLASLWAHLERLTKLSASAANQ